MVQQGSELAQAGNFFADVLKVNHLEPSFLERLGLELGFLKENLGGNNLFQPGQLGTGKHGGSARGVIEDGRHFAGSPQTE